MKINSNETDHIRNNFCALAPLYFILTIVGLGCELTCKTNTKLYWRIVKDFLRTFILACIICFSMQYKVRYLYDTLSPSIKYTDFLQMIYDFMQYIIDLYFVRKYGTEVSLEYFKQYATIDQIIGAVNYCTIRRRLVKLMVIFALLWTSSTICDFGAWVLSYSWQDSSVYSIAYVFLLIKIFTTLDLTAQVLHIEVRLSTVGDLLQTRCNETEDTSPFFETNNSKNDFLKSKVTSSQTPLNTLRVSCVDSHELKWLSRCYLLLTEQATFINKLYGVRILLNSLSLLIDMVRFTNIAARILIGTQQTRYYSGYFPVVSSLMRMMTCAAVLASLVYHCEQVYRQRDRILDIIDHLLVYKNPSNHLKTAASELRDLIQARPITLSMANFFRLDYSLLVSITSVVVTYTIILLQSIN